jgi:hypothetical protein
MPRKNKKIETSCNIEKIVRAFQQHIFVARLWNFDEKFAHHNRQFIWFYPSSYYPII